MTRVLVTGGAGYIGSHTGKALRSDGFDVVVLDNLSEGHRAAVEGVRLVEANCGDRPVLDALLGEGGVEAAIHFAARCYVGESVTDPLLYWRENVAGTLTLLAALVDHGGIPLIFSSSCAVYGEPGAAEIAEELPRAPVNPYGRTKAALEWAMEDFGAAYGLRSVRLRYFNAAGADPDGVLGEDHDPETHLVPLVIREALTGAGRFTVFGNDYPTPDGTCVRDYIHVADLADAHVRAARHLLAGGAGGAMNLGTGRGYSVLQIAEAVERRSGRPVARRAGERRPGDPAYLVARPGRAREVLGWEPRHSGLEEIVDTSYRWFEAHPDGYGD